MKFTETLSSHLTPEWRSQYIDYGMLKSMLVQARGFFEQSSYPFSMAKAFFINFDVEFFARCLEELNKVNNFFSEKLAEAVRKHNALMADISASFVKHRADISVATMKTLHKRKIPVLRFLLSEHYLNLTLINNYQTLNFTGFRKILKKHDKLFMNSYGRQWLESYVRGAHFYKNVQIDTMMSEIENAYTIYLEKGDRTRAMKCLRVPPLSERQSPFAVFRSGFFLGVAIILFLCCIFAPPIDTPMNEVMFLRLFTPATLLVLFMFFLSINVYGWRHAGVNHILIFEIDPRIHLTAIDVLEIASMLCILLLLCVLGFLYHAQINIPRYAFPLLLDLLILVYVFNPIPVLKRHSRMWMLRIIGRLLASPFTKVKFADFWIGDQLCSLAPCLTEFAFTMCFYMTIEDWRTVEKKCACANEAWGYLTVMRCLPSWWRLAQCMRRYHDNRKNFIHLINAFKYISSILVVLWATAMSLTQHNYNKLTENPCGIGFLVFATISATYSLAYDLKQDWGFFENKETLLRNHLIYTPKIYYYLAIIENVLIRFRWVIVLLVSIYIRKISYLGIIMDSFEIFRRFVWNFFRLENEHLNNVGQYRAVRDIHVKALDHTPIVPKDPPNRESGGTI